MLKKLFSVLFAALALLTMTAWRDLNYARPGNWFIRESGRENAVYDVFYLYPTLFASRETALMSRDDEAVMKKAAAFVRAQTGIFGGDARIFAPFVRQLEFHRAIAVLDRPPMETELRKGIFDARRAFRFYLEHDNGGRPFILFGHSQGAVELYELLRQETAISPRTGFVAAYLPGFRLTAAQVARDFAGRGIAPARGADDRGVLVVWNTQNAEARDSLFTGPGTLCINPLNWRTDGTPAPAAANPGAFFYDYRDGSSRFVPGFCGARVDPAQGALIVDLPSNGAYDAKGMMGAGVFHMNDVWFFAEALRRNALTRVRAPLPTSP
ncbi:MAG: DUF3089 domain-containing protein [Lentisphaeria bacterium]|nr:DUF3089 domain-containing protein [Lentisphaeria bacterium]